MEKLGREAWDEEHPTPGYPKGPKKEAEKRKNPKSWVAGRGWRHEGDAVEPLMNPDQR